MFHAKRKELTFASLFLVRSNIYNTFEKRLFKETVQIEDPGGLSSC